MMGYRVACRFTIPTGVDGDQDNATILGCSFSLPITPFVGLRIDAGQSFVAEVRRIAFDVDREILILDCGEASLGEFIGHRVVTPRMEVAESMEKAISEMFAIAQGWGVESWGWLGQFHASGRANGG